MVVTYGTESVVIAPDTATSDIQAAINTIAANGGGTVQLLSGTYTLNADLTLSSNVNLFGQGSVNTILDFNYGAFGILAKGSSAYTTGSVTISFGGTTVVGTGTTWTSGMVGQSILLEDFWYAITVFTDAQHITIGSSYAGSNLTNFRYAIATTIDSTKIHGVTLQNSSASLLKMKYVNSIEYNDILAFNGNVGFDHSYVANVNSVVSIADTCGTGYILNDTVFATWFGFNALNSTGVGTSANYFRNSAIDVFAVQANAGVGMSFTNVKNVGLDNFSLQANTGIQVEFVSGNQGVAFVDGIAINGTSDAFKLTASSSDIQIIGTQISGNGGYGVNVAASSCNRNVIVGNSFSSNISGHITNSGTDTVIDGNSPASVNVNSSAHARATAQVAANTNVLTYTVGASDTTFQVLANVLVTTSTLHSFGVTVDYTDESNTARTLTIPMSQLAGTLITAITNATGAGPYEGVALTIRCKAATNIVFKTAGTFTTVTYNVDASISQIA